MKKLSDYKGNDALDVLADLIDPIGNIVGDGKIVKMLQNGDMKVVAKALLKDYRDPLMEVLAILEEVPKEEYIKNVNLFTLPKAVISILNDPDLLELFQFQGQEVASSGSVTGNTEGKNL